MNSLHLEPTNLVICSLLSLTWKFKEASCFGVSFFFGQGGSRSTKPRVKMETPWPFPFSFPFQASFCTLRRACVHMGRYYSHISRYKFCTSFLFPQSSWCLPLIPSSDYLLCSSRLIFQFLCHS